MSLKTRKILFIIFVLVFLILTPAISFYASGYSLGNGLSLQKTGILILKSEPSGAKIYINNKLQQNFINKFFNKDQGFLTTPQKIKALIPGDYIIKVEKDGYWPWEKKLTIKPGESTFAEDIILFKNDQPALIKNGNTETGKISLVNDKLISINNNTISFQTDNNGIRDFIFPEKTTDDIKVSPEKSKIIAGRYIYNLNDLNSDPVSLDKLIGAGSKNIQWGKNENEIFYISESQIYFFDIATNKSSSLFQNQNFSDYLAKNNLIFYISNVGSTSELNVYDKDKNELIKKISLPLSTYVFNNPDNNLINLYDSSHNILYLIDPLSPVKQLQETISNVKQSFWLNDKTLIFANNFEIWSLDLNYSKKTLLTRISNEIKALAPQPKKNYIFFSTNAGIYSLELDDREKYNITELMKLEKINNLIINKKGDSLFFNGKIGEQEGVFKLEI